jgi:site-specific DNA-cytosine methylase
MNVLSLFDGISCGQVALNRIGIKYDNYFASEIDKYAIQVTQKQYPKTEQLGSIIELDGAKLPKIDLLFGGSPCQSFSIAGDGTGFDGKSGLFWDYVRILKETKPNYFLLENVKMKKEWEQIITNALGVEPIEIPSKLVSAQNRVRLYWTNIPVRMPVDRNILLADVIEKDFVFTSKAQTILSTMYKENAKSMFKRNKKGLLACSKQCAECKFIKPKSNTVRTGGLKSYQRHEWDSVCKLHLRKLTPFECERLQTLPDNYTDCLSNTRRYQTIGNGWTVDVIAHIFSFLKGGKK